MHKRCLYQKNLSVVFSITDSIMINLVAPLTFGLHSFLVFASVLRRSAFPSEGCTGILGE